MQDLTPISVDDRRFTISEWFGFLLLFSFITGHCAGFTSGVLAAIWGDVWVGDFTKTDLLWDIGQSVVAVPALVVWYGLLYLGLTGEQFTRGSLLLDGREGRLVSKRRHITGFSFRKSLALSDVRDITVEWTKDEDGNHTPTLQLIPAGRPVQPWVTNPADSADLPAFAARFRAQLAAAGWSDGTSKWMPSRYSSFQERLVSLKKAKSDRGKPACETLSASA
jgi:hypothetical protein